MVNGKLYITLGIVASIITIIIFFSGKSDIWSLLNSTPTAETVIQPTYVEEQLIEDNNYKEIGFDTSFYIYRVLFYVGLIIVFLLAIIVSIFLASAQGELLIALLLTLSLGWKFNYYIFTEKPCENILYLAKRGDPVKQYQYSLLFTKTPLFIKTSELENTETFWLEQSASQGLLQAQYELATRFLIEGNLHDSFIWFLKAAKQNYSSAQYRVAIMYQNGDGVKQNIEKAKYWYEKAARAGNIHAKRNLQLLQ